MLRARCAHASLRRRATRRARRARPTRAPDAPDAPRSGVLAGVAAVLALDSFITFVNLEGTDLADDGVVAVSDALRTHPTLFRLDLGYNGVGGKGVKALASLLLDSPSLLCLDLSGNNLCSRLAMFAPASMSVLAPLGKALASPCCKLQLLHLDQADVEHKGLGALVDGLVTNESIVNLRLGENGGPRGCARARERASRDETGAARAQPSHLSHLSHLSHTSPTSLASLTLASLSLRPSRSAQRSRRALQRTSGGSSLTTTR